MCCHAQPLPIDALPSGYNTGCRELAVFGAARAARRATHAVSAAVVRAALVRHDALAARAAEARLARARHAAAAEAAAAAAVTQPAEALARALGWASHWCELAAPHAAEASVALALAGDARAVARAAAGAVAQGRAFAPLPREPCVAGAGSVVAQAAAVASAVAGADEGHDKRAVVARVSCVTLADGRLRRHVAAPVAAAVVGAHVVERFAAVWAPIPGIAGADALLAGAVRPTAVLAAVALR